MSTKTALTVILISLGISLAKAQLLIPKGGIAFSKTTWTPYGYPSSSISNIIGYSAGLGFEFKLYKHYNLLLEGLYVKKGQNFNYNSIPSRSPDRDVGHVIYTFNYFDFPFLIKKYFGKTWFKSYVNLGPYLSVGIGGSIKFEETQYSLSNGGVDGYYKYDAKVKYGVQPNFYNGNDMFIKHQIDYGVVMGGGVLLFNKIMVDARYGMGMTNLTVNRGDYKMRSIQLSIGVPIKLSSK